MTSVGGAKTRIPYCDEVSLEPEPSRKYNVSSFVSSLEQGSSGERYEKMS